MQTGRLVGGQDETGCAHLDIEIVVNLQGLSEEKDELVQVGKLPHIPEALEDRWLRWSVGIVGVGLRQRPLPNCRHLDSWSQVTLMMAKRRRGAKAKGMRREGCCGSQRLGEKSQMAKRRISKLYDV